MAKKKAGDDKLVVRIKRASFDDFGESIVIRGVLDEDSLDHLQVDDYQREAGSRQAHAMMARAIMGGQRLPDIELGMRGQRYNVVKLDDGSEEFVLADPVFIVDGYQRTLSARLAREMLAAGTSDFGTHRPHLGCMVHVDSSKEWERLRFEVLNVARSKVSPNVILRNKCDDEPYLAMMYTLTTADRGCAISGRVAWKQRMGRGELVSARMTLMVAGALHTHLSTARRSSLDELVPALQRQYNAVGKQVLSTNIKAFYRLIDECWGIARVQYREGASYMRGTFLYVLACVLSDHENFWDGNKLTISLPDVRKIKSFPIADPEVVRLSGSSGKARDLLYRLLVDHINSGRRTGRLVSRLGGGTSFSDDHEDDGDRDVGGDDSK